MPPKKIIRTSISTAAPVANPNLHLPVLPKELSPIFQTVSVISIMYHPLKKVLRILVATPPFQSFEKGILLAYETPVPNVNWTFMAIPQGHVFNPNTGAQDPYYAIQPFPAISECILLLTYLWGGTGFIKINNEPNIMYWYNVFNNALKSPVFRILPKEVQPEYLSYFNIYDRILL